MGPSFTKFGQQFSVGFSNLFGHLNLQRCDQVTFLTAVFSHPHPF